MLALLLEMSCFVELLFLCAVKMEMEKVNKDTISKHAQFDRGDLKIRLDLFP